MEFSWQTELGLLLASVIGIGLVLRMISRPIWILYGLALVCSITTVNIYIGFSLYLSRVLLIIFALMLFTVPGTRRLRGDGRFLFLFAGCIGAQLLSLLNAPDMGAGVREIFIYLSLMAIFVVVIVMGQQPSDILKAIGIYLGVGAAQGVLGLYQVIGGLLDWPSYQNLLSALPVATDNMRIALFYAPDVGLPRASGFHVDPNNYAGYLVGIILISVTLIVWNRRAIFPYVCLGLGSMGLLLSLSRSGILTLGLGGVALLFLLRQARFKVKRLFRVVFFMAIMITLLGTIAGLLGSELRTSTGTLNVVGGAFQRLSRLVDTSEYSGNEEEHMLTRLAALDALASSPLIGIGIGNVWYSARFDQYWGGSHSHHLDMLGQTGLFGAVWQWAFMALVGAYMWRGVRASRPGSREQATLVGLLAAFIAILLGNFLYHYYLTDFVWFLMGAGVALSRAIVRQKLGNVTVV